MGLTASMALTMGNASGQFVSQQAQARAVTNQAAFNAKLSDLDARDAIARGNTDASGRLLQARRTVGAQRAAQAASGIDANYGTAADLQTDESGMGALDAQIIRNNAAREAWGYQAQSALGTAAAQNEAANLKAQSYNTLLTGAANTYGLYRQTRSTMGSSDLASSLPKPPRGGYNVVRK